MIGSGVVGLSFAIRAAAHGSATGSRKKWRLRVIRYQDRVELIPIRPIETLRGFLKGIDTKIEREGDRL